MDNVNILQVRYPYSHITLTDRGTNPFVSQREMFFRVG